MTRGGPCLQVDRGPLKSLVKYPVVGKEEKEIDHEKPLYPSTMIFKGPIDSIKLFRVSCAQTARVVEAVYCRVYQDEQMPAKGATVTDRRYNSVFTSSQGVGYQSDRAAAQEKLNIRVHCEDFSPKCVDVLDVVADLDGFYAGAFIVIVAIVAVR